MSGELGGVPRTLQQLQAAVHDEAPRAHEPHAVDFKALGGGCSFNGSCEMSPPNSPYGVGCMPDVHACGTVLPPCLKAITIDRRSCLRCSLPLRRAKYQLLELIAKRPN